MPDKRKWQEMVSRYFYSEDEDSPLEVPETLRSSKYIVCPEVSHPSHPSPETIDGAGPQGIGTLGTLGTVRGTRNNEMVTPLTNGHAEAVLGMPVEKVIEIWRIIWKQNKEERGN